MKKLSKVTLRYIVNADTDTNSVALRKKTALLTVIWILDTDADGIALPGSTTDFVFRSV